MTGLDMERYRSANAVELAAALRSGSFSPTALVDLFTAQVDALDRSGPELHSVMAINPNPVVAGGGVRNPGTGIAGIPLLLKDNIDVAGAWCGSAGSLALADSQPGRSAAAVDRLLAAGSVPVGAANMAEWANFRSSRSTNGWSGRGGLTRNPYFLDRSAGGSSSGSAVAVAAGIVPLAIGSETDGSILNPAAYNGVVGIKPTVGSVDGRGVVPISHAQDTLGPLARTVRDAAMVLTALSGVDHSASCRIGAAGGLRVGLLDQRFWGNHPAIPALLESVVRALSGADAKLVEQVDLPGASELAESDSESTRLLNDFRCDLTSYLSTRIGHCPASLKDLIEFNKSHAEVELRYFGQDIFEAAADTEGTSEAEYRLAVDTCLRCGRDEGIDAALRRADADCLIVPHFDPAPKIDLVNGDPGNWMVSRPSAIQASAVAGYPGVSVPIGDVEGLPIGLTILGTAHSEPRLLAVAFAIESAMDARLTPQFRRPAVG